MSNTTISIQASAMYYHAAPAAGGSTKIRKGECRKGLKNGTDYIGFIYFKPADIKAAVNQGTLRAAKLVLTRSDLTGQGARTVGLTQYQLADVSLNDCYTHKQVYDKTYKSCYEVTTQAGQTTVDLPCALYRRLRSPLNYRNIIVLCSGPDETSNDYAAFSGAELQLIVGDTWEKPVWNRPISTGDLVCDEDHSHRADLYELSIYISQRARDDGLDILDQLVNEDINDGYYVKWALIIGAMWSKVKEIMHYEDPDAPIPNLAPPAAGSIPNAGWINRLRRFCETEPGGGPGSRLSIEAAGRAYYTTQRGFMEHDPSWKLSWRAGEAPLSGKVWGWINSKTTKEYSHRFGVWLLPSLSGQTVNSLALQLTTAKGQDRGAEDNVIRLYPLKVSAFPAGDSQTPVGEIIDFTTVAGEATSAGVGRTAPGDFVETLAVPLSAAFIAGLQGGTYYGVAVECDQVIREYTKTAELLVNGG